MARRTAAKRIRRSSNVKESSTRYAAVNAYTTRNAAVNARIGGEQH